MGGITGALDTLMMPPVIGASVDIPHDGGAVTDGPVTVEQL